MALSTTTIMLIATGAGVLATILSVVVIMFAYFYVKQNNVINELRNRVDQIERLVYIREQAGILPTNPAVIKDWDVDKKFVSMDAAPSPVKGSSIGTDVTVGKSDDFLKAMDDRINKAVSVSGEYHQSRDVQSVKQDTKEDYIKKMDRRVNNATAFLKDNDLDRVEVAPAADIKPDSLLKLRKISTESKPDPLAGSVDEVYDSIMKPKQPPTQKRARIISYKVDQDR